MPLPDLDWRALARTVLVSRAIDRIEEEELVPSGLVKYQFTARGHDMAQAILGQLIDHPRDAAGVYYRSRPFVLSAGLTPEEAISATMGRAGAPNGGRDIGVVFSLPPRGRATILPMSGAVGAQYTPAIGWAHGIRYRAETLGEADWQGALAVALGGDGSCATPGFWAALNIATTGRLPYLFYIEDNGYAISVERRFQTPGSHIADNLASFQGLTVLNGDGTEPEEAARLIAAAVGRIRAGEGPVLLRLSVPRLSGHSYQDNQAYKSEALRAEEQARDPLPKLREFLVPELLDEATWAGLETEAEAEVRAAAERAAAQPEGDPDTALRFLFSASTPEQPQALGGTRPEGVGLPLAFGRAPAPPTPERKNLVDTVRMTLEAEMRLSPRLLVFGEDVGAKGGVHGATMDMQLHFGDQRVFDTALTEEGIIGRAVGLAYAGLVPVPEIQFRKYADPATEQLNDCGTVRWRTNGRFAAPVVVRMPVGFSPATGDPWHSVSDESILAHSVGWQVVMPADAEEAAGLLRTALRGDDPVYFLEHRALYFGAEARRPYPGDDYMIPFGQARRLSEGDQLTLVTWGAMVHRCLEAAAGLEGAVEILDLRTIVPWDRATVLDSVARTGRCLLVHEDHQTAGFGAEIAAVIAESAFEQLDAPVARLCGLDCPVPYSISMMQGVVPSVARIRAAIDRQLAY
ncbi:MAG: pyruvate dehydrogenase [Caldilineae bacterium]|nr:pyruvate dehydrogenase [Chloroflexota bacterium]MCB9176422.1 pyruvate dehydrogenase [Caldilineae bacterium]